MNHNPVPSVPVAPEHPWRLACSRTVAGVRTFLHEYHATRADALLALELYALTGEWDAMVMTPAPHAQGTTTRHLLAVGGRLMRPAREA